MDAEKGFRLWRRILREDALQDAAMAGDGALVDLLSPDEVEIAVAIAQHRRAARWPIRGYRFRVVDQLSEILREQAPLTAAWLEGRGRLEDVSLAFARAHSWPDPGLRSVAMACELLDAIASSTASEGVPGLADAIAFEKAQNQLLLRLAPLPLEAWAARAAPPRIAAELRYRLVPSTIVVTLEHDLGPWIEDPASAASVPVERKPHEMLIYLNDIDVMPEYAILTPAGARLHRRLEAGPLTLAEAAELLGEGSAGRARSIFTRFAALGILRIEGAEVAAEVAGAGIVYGSHWDGLGRFWRTSGAHPIYDALVDSVVAGCGELHDTRVLDAGCGDGRTAVALARRGATVLAVDLSPECVATARAHVAEAAPECIDRISFRALDLGHLDLCDGEIDVITCLKVLWCIPGLDRVLRELHRVLRPGGALVTQLWADCDTEVASLGLSIVGRFVSGLEVPDDCVPPGQLTSSVLASLVADAGFAAPREAVFHTRRFKLATPADFRALLSRTADTVHLAYATQPPDVRAAMDEMWRMETSRARARTGTTAMDVSWSVVVCPRS